VSPRLVRWCRHWLSNFFGDEPHVHLWPDVLDAMSAELPGVDRQSVDRAAERAVGRLIRAGSLVEVRVIGVPPERRVIESIAPALAAPSHRAIFFPPAGWRVRALVWIQHIGPPRDFLPRSRSLW
jgi:hypothetical protein